MMRLDACQAECGAVSCCPARGELYIKKKGRIQPNVLHKPEWRVALIANLKQDSEFDPLGPVDSGAEFDQVETVEAVRRAIESDGHEVHFLKGDHTLPERLAEVRPDICFNMAEGLRGDGREAQVPALLELLGIPYTGSKVVTNAISLDKTQTKRIWRESGLPTAPFREFTSPDGVRNTALRFPIFVKPSREGTGMGIDSSAVVRNHKQLAERVSWVISTYKQPALVEEYLPGREFTVGFIGNPGTNRGLYRTNLYDDTGYHWFPVLEIDTQSSVSPGIYGHAAKEKEIHAEGAPEYLCPADISEELSGRLINLARRAAQALEVLDFGRVDFRMGARGEPYLLEINTLPGLNPSLSDLCIMAQAEGVQYDTLINEILYLAAERYDLVSQTADFHADPEKTAQSGDLEHSPEERA